MHKLIIDSRENKNTHILKQLNLLDVNYKIDKLEIGDYQLENNPTITIDRKASMEELANNLGVGRERFKAEIMRAYENNVKFIVLLEYINLERDVLQWESKKNKDCKPFTKMNRNVMFAQMSTLSERYNVIWKYCKKSEIGRKIIELLRGEINDK